MAIHIFKYIIELKVLFFIISISLFLTSCVSQQTTIKPYPSYEVDIPINGSSILEVDDFGNVYAVINNMMIHKYNLDLQLQHTYDGNQQEEISHIDASNPLKILAFYPDFQIIKFLDNTLSEISNFELSKISEEISLVAMSNDNNIWIYDVIESKIKKVSNFGEILISSPPISDIVGAVFDPTFLKESNNQIYIYDEAFGLLIFDFACNFTNRIPLPNKLLVDLQNDQMISIDVAHKIWSESSNISDMKSSEILLYQAPVSPNAVQIFNNKIYLSTPKGLIIDDINFHLESNSK